MFHNFFNIADIDECAELGNQICINGVCRNRIGGFSCQCNIGYTLDDSRRNCRGKKAQKAVLFHLSFWVCKASLAGMLSGGGVFLAPFCAVKI